MQWFKPSVLAIQLRLNLAYDLCIEIYNYAETRENSASMVSKSHYALAQIYATEIEVFNCLESNPPKPVVID